MSKARGPLLSVNATGQIGKSLIFFNWKGIHRVKKYKKPVQPDTQAQLDKRLLMNQAVSRWQTFFVDLKRFWNEAIKTTRKIMSGYNYFLSEYLNSMIAGKTPEDYPPDKYYTKTIILDGLVSWWKLDEGQGVDARDSKNNNHGIVTGADWVDGLIGKALNFIINDDYVTVQHNNNLNLPAFTIEAWININSFTVNYQRIVQKGGAFQFFVLDDGRLQLQWYNGTENQGMISTDTVSLGTWHHVVATLSNSINRIYIDTSMNGPDVDTGNPEENTNVLTIGNREAHDRQLDGIIDELKIYNRALSQQEVEHNFNYRS